MHSSERRAMGRRLAACRCPPSQFATTSSSSISTAPSGSASEPTPGAVETVGALREAGKRVAFATNDPRSATEDYVTRLWGIGIQASLADVVTVGGAVQHLLAETRSGRTAFVIGTPSLRRHVGDAGPAGAQRHRPRVARGGRDRRRHRGPRLRRPAHRDAGRAPRRRLPRHRPRSHLSAAGRPLARHRRDPRRGRVRHRPQRAGRRQARAAAAADRARPARRGQHARGRRPRRRRPAGCRRGAASTRRSCSPAAPRAAEAAAARPAAVAVADSLSELLAGP